MTTYYVGANGSDSYSAAQAQNPATPWRNIIKLNQNLVAGDVGLIGPGSYSGSNNVVNPDNSGTSTNPITYRATAPGVAISDPNASNVGSSANLSGNTDIYLDGLNFLSTSSMWIVTDSSSHRIRITNCGFNSTWLGVNNYAFTGVRLSGNDCRLHNCTFGQWFGGDMVELSGNRNWVKNNDMNYADCGHGTIVVYGDYNLVENCYIRNKFSRFAHLAPSKLDATTITRNAFLNNTVIDTNPVNNGDNEGYPVRGWAIYGDPNEFGDAQMGKSGGTGLLVRGNLIVASNSPSNITFTSHPYKCIFQIDNYDSTVYYEKIRFAHNTLLDNNHNGFSVTENTVNPHAFEFDDNRWRNNVIANCIGGLSFRMATGGAYLATYEWRNNLCTEDIRRGALPNRNWATFEADFPSQASGNQQATPIFVNSNYSSVIGSVAARANKINRDNFVLHSSSPGYQDGIHMATVASNSSGQTITLGAGEAWWFFDGNGIAGRGGDEISVNGNVRTITSIPNENQIVVNSNVTVTAGQLVYLTEYGTDPTIGIAPSTGVAPEPDEWVINLLDTKTTSANTSTPVSNSISPTAGSTLGVIFSLVNSNATACPTVSSIATTLANITDWEKVVEQTADEAIDSSIFAYVAKVGNTPGSGTVTATLSNNCTGYHVIIFEITNNDPAQLVVQSGKVSSQATSVTTSLPSAANINNIIISALRSRGDTSITKDPDYTLIGSATLSGVTGVQYRTGVADSDAVWSDLSTSRNVGIIFELATSAVAPELPDPPEAYRFISQVPAPLSSGMSMGF